MTKKRGVTGVTAHALTDAEKAALSLTSAAWTAHLSTCSGFGCSSKTWPTP